MSNALKIAAGMVGGGGGGETDPYFANVVSLLPLESDLVDVKLGAVWAAGGSGGVTFETKGGKLCARPAANAAYIHIPVAGNRTPFAINGDAPWTAEMEVWNDPSYATAVPTWLCIGAGFGSGLHIWPGGSANKVTIDTTIADIPGHAGTVGPGAWYKVSASYDGTNLYTHINGINNRTTPTTAFANPFNTTFVGLGFFGQAYTPANFWIRQFRFTAGVDRYGAANYTPEEHFPEA